MDIFKKIFASLKDESVKYMVAGGIAVNLYGIERATADIDLVVKLDEENLLRFIKVCHKLGLRPKAPVKLEDFADSKKRDSWMRDKGLMVFSLFDSKNSFFLLDVFVESPFNFDEVYKQAKKIKFDDTVIDVVPIQELIKMKENSNRPQDEADVFYLNKIVKEWTDES